MNDPTQQPPALPPVPHHLEQQQRDEEARRQAVAEFEQRQREIQQQQAQPPAAPGAAPSQQPPFDQEAVQQPAPPAPAQQPNPGPVGMPGQSAQAPVQLPTQPVEAAEVERPKSVPENWPQPGYDGPQPFEVEEPPQLTHDRGLVTSGAAGAAVTELAACLAHLGIGTAISEGKNVHMVYGPTEVAAVEEFRRVYGVEEDPSIVRGNGASVVGPWTWEALFRAVRQKAAQ